MMDVFCSKLCNDATSEGVKYLFRAANVWVEVCAVFLLLPLVDRCLETIYVCIWRMLVLCLL